MASDPFELYPVIAQIAAVFAGFGSLASGLGKRRGADDARIDAFRLGMMLCASLSATLLGLLPATLAGLLAGPTIALRTSAAIAALSLVIYMPLPFCANSKPSRRPRVQQDRRSPERRLLIRGAGRVCSLRARNLAGSRASTLSAGPDGTAGVLGRDVFARYRVAPSDA